MINGRGFSKHFSMGVRKHIFQFFGDEPFMTWLCRFIPKKMTQKIPKLPFPPETRSLPPKTFFNEKYVPMKR